MVERPLPGQYHPAEELPLSRAGVTLPPMFAFSLLILFALLFVGGHMALSSLPVRDRLVAVLGEKLFVPVYASLQAASLGGLIWAWSRAPMVWLWEGPRGLAWLPLAVMPIALWLLVESLTRNNPAAVNQGASPIAAQPKGLFAVTRHPGMWGIALWGASHVAVNGDLASVIFMSSVVVLALAGSAHIDARRRAKLGAGWHDYAKHTSWLPFLALTQGRARVQPAELGWWRPLLAVSLYAALLHLHSILFGASPLP